MFAIWLYTPILSLLAILNPIKIIQAAEAIRYGPWYINLIVMAFGLIGFSSWFMNIKIYGIVSEWLNDYSALDKMPEKLKRLIVIIGFIVWITPTMILFAIFG